VSAVTGPVAGSTSEATRPRRAAQRDGVSYVADVFRLLVVAMFTLLVLAPIIWLLLTAFKPDDELFVSPPVFLTSEPTLGNFSAGWEVGGGKGIVDSLIVTSLSTLACLVLGVPAAYGLARKFPVDSQLGFTILSLRMLPPVVPGIGFYLIFTRIGLFDTYLGLVLLYTFMNLPLVIWLLAEFIRQIPVSYEEAAFVDGAPWWRAAWDVVVPLAAPGIVASGILAAIFSWNEFFFSLVLTGEEVITFPKALANFFLFQQPNWGQLGAMGVIALVPLMVCAFYMQRYLIRSFSFKAGGR